jgi:xanthine dehydrogenase accessory factor
MRDVMSDLDRWLTEGKAIAVAAVIQAWGSAPRRAGATMALTADGDMSGSVSGGCVESAVFEAGLDVLKTRRPQRLHFGIGDESAFEIGLACGGQIDVFVKLFNPTLHAQLRAGMDAKRSMAVATITRGPIDRLGGEMLLRDDGQIFGEDLGEAARAAAQATLDAGQPRYLSLPIASEEPIEVFIDVILPPPELVAVGGVHISIALTAIAKTMGYRTVVIDPRGVFGSEARFPRVDQLIRAWPDEALAQIELTRSSAVAVLTHEPKLDDPALLMALPSAAFYVGALGSRKTQASRRERLLRAGLSEAQVARLHGPIGIRLGAQTPEEIALAIMAEIVAERNGA